MPKPWGRVARTEMDVRPVCFTGNPARLPFCPEARKIRTLARMGAACPACFKEVAVMSRLVLSGLLFLAFAVPCATRAEPGICCFPDGSCIMIDGEEACFEAGGCAFIPGAD